MLKSEYPLLEDFLYNAIYISDGEDQPPKSIIQKPELQVYIERFGESKDDIAMVAEVGSKVIGAVWVRVMDDYGHIDDITPSLAISLYKEYRSRGIGSALIKQMLLLLKDRGYKSVSLSVQRENFALKMYLKSGFNILEEKDEEYIMVCQL